MKKKRPCCKEVWLKLISQISLQHNNLSTNTLCFFGGWWSDLYPARVIFMLCVISCYYRPCYEDWRFHSTIGPYWWEVNFGSGNGLALNKRQDIAWTNVKQVVWCHMASLSRNKLTHWGRDKMAAIFQATFSNAFLWMKIYEYRWKISLKLGSEGSN